MVLWEKLRISRASRGKAMTAERVDDLKLAASFVKSIETADADVNFEIQQVALKLERIAGRLDTR